mmetsp:Transcript_25351/g.63589  ORF Transcript_25351/g.63589 Transcript_25351/m.63589 type:complete len:157 (-) Transcript_25351:229-699(-)
MSTYDIAEPDKVLDPQDILAEQFDSKVHAAVDSDLTESLHNALNSCLACISDPDRLPENQPSISRDLEHQVHEFFDIAKTIEATLLKAHLISNLTERSAPSTESSAGSLRREIERLEEDLQEKERLLDRYHRSLDSWKARLSAVQSENSDILENHL